MTVRQLIDELAGIPDDAEVTDCWENPITRMGFEVDEEDPERMIVWLDTEFEPGL